MEALLSSQLNLSKYINNFYTNSLKVAKDQITPTYIKTRVELLKEYWQTFGANDAKLSGTETELSEHEYFEKDYFSKVEMNYCTTLAKLKDLQDKISPNSTEPSLSNQQSSSFMYNPLPKMELQKFAGNLSEWPSFRDLFKAMVHNNQHLSGSQKLFYLKSCLVGAAESILSNTTLEDANYPAAWQTICDRFENKRILINAYLKNLMDITNMRSESAEDLRKLCDGTNEVYQALRALERPVEQWDDWLVFLTVQKLHPSLRKDWEVHISQHKDVIPFKFLMSFLQNRLLALQSLVSHSTTIRPFDKRTSTISRPSSSSSSPSSSSIKTPIKTSSLNRPTIKSHHSTASSKCSCCQENHLLLFCPSFRQKLVPQRRDFIAKKQLCFNCLKSDHRASDCPSSNRCKHCNQLHHSLLHLNSTENDSSPSVTLNGKCNAQQSTSSSSSSSTARCATRLPESPVQSHSAVFCSSRPVTHCNVLLATAKVILNANGRSIIVRALLDPGSQASFITSSLASLLRLRKSRVNVQVFGVSSSRAGSSSAQVSVVVQSRVDPDFHLEVRALVLPELTHFLPQTSVDPASFSHLQGLDLADPDLNDNSPVELIIGADSYMSLMLDGIKIGKPSAQRTALGWVLSGPVAEEPPAETMHGLSITVSDSDTDQFIRKFWEIEEPSGQSAVLSQDDIYCEDFYQRTTRRASDGRYIVYLPRKSSVSFEFPNSKLNAVRSLLAMERRFNKDELLKERYRAFMKEYLDLDHMERVENDCLDDKFFYLPHHGVLRESSITTKLRVVFNGSKRTIKGFSLNDCLLPGPALQKDIRHLLLAWRQHRVVFTADIRMMFRQILVSKEDQDLQRIVWRDSSSSSVDTFRLKTVTYGTCPAPFLAIRTLQRLAEDEKDTFPLGSQSLLNDFYCDDVLSGADDIDHALSIQSQLINILQSGGFMLHKWSSNHPALMKVVSAENSLVDLSNDETVHILGLLWNPSNDHFTFKVTLDEIPTKLTRRNILSDVAKLYDPLGFISPSVLQAKALFQSLWLEKSLDWDDEVPDRIGKTWTAIRKDLKTLENVTVPRWLGSSSSANSYEMHGFADASERAYAAVLYLRVVDNDHTSVSLIGSKTKLAPLKKLSIPRLELCAARLLAELISSWKNVLKVPLSSVTCWTDAQIVLTWLHAHPSKWKPFIANRCSSIHDLIPDSHWRHVPGSSNPADCASRGLSPDALLQHQLWWQGPTWLSNPSSCWPISERTSFEEDQQELQESTRATFCATTAVTNEDNKDSDFIKSLLSKYSSLDRLLRVTALLLRLGKTKTFRSQACIPISADEVEKALVFWIRLSQQASFPDEYRRLSKGEQIRSNSRLVRLNPVFDAETTCLRINGRLQNTSSDGRAKQPFVLAKTCQLSNLIVRDAHLRTLHGGKSLTMRYIQERYWILSCGDKVRRFIRQCIPCFRYRANAKQQLMGMLPTCRVTPSRPFSSTGLDFAGPIQVRYGPGRGRPAHKAYIAVFVCMATKAIHVELVSDLSTEAFIAAYKRFTARRGLCEHVYSDNGKNFVGADKVLQSNFFAAQQQLPDDLTHLLATHRTTWHFIPPHAPNFGGLWEAGVKSVKHHLRRVINDTTLTFEELATLLTQVEACLNSRPLYAVNEDPTDYNVLTPGHFLIGSPLLAVPEPHKLDASMSALSRWKLLNQMLSSFWSRWSVDYLNSLQKRTKWQREQPNIQKGDLVLVRDDILPPSKWLLGRVQSTSPGADGLVRVATIRTQSSTIKRPISKLAVLPLADKNSEDDDQTYSSTSPGRAD